MLSEQGDGARGNRDCVLAAKVADSDPGLRAGENLARRLDIAGCKYES